MSLQLWERPPMLNHTSFKKMKNENMNEGGLYKTTEGTPSTGMEVHRVKRECESSICTEQFYKGNIDFYEDVLSVIFEYIYEPKDLFICTQVCHLWRKLLQSANFWRRKIMLSFPLKDVPFSLETTELVSCKSSSQHFPCTLATILTRKRNILMSKMLKLLKEWYNDWACYWSLNPCIDNQSDEKSDEQLGLELMNIDSGIYVFDKKLRLWEIGIAHNRHHEQYLNHFQEGRHDVSFNHLLQEQLLIVKQFANKCADENFLNFQKNEHLAQIQAQDDELELKDHEMQEFDVKNVGNRDEDTSQANLVLQEAESFDWYRQAKEEEDKKIDALIQKQENQIVSLGKKYITNSTYNPSFPNNQSKENDQRTLRTLLSIPTETIDSYRKFVPKYFNPEKYWPKYKEIIQKKFSRHHLEIESIENVVQNELSGRFSALWSEEEGGVPVLAFHGTPSQNISSIVQQGLVIPGKGNNIPVAHGSIYGLGIYLSLDPSISVSYCEGSNKMFVCALLVGKSFYTTRAGHIIVAFNARQVLPCWIITFKKPKQRLFYTPSLKQKDKSDQKLNNILPAQYKDLSDHEREEMFNLAENRGFYIDMQLMDSFLSNLVGLNHTKATELCKDIQYFDGELVNWSDPSANCSYPLIPFIFRHKGVHGEDLTLEQFANTVGLHEELWKDKCRCVKWKNIRLYEDEPLASNNEKYLSEILPTQTSHKEFIKKYMHHVKFVMVGITQMNPVPVFIIGTSKIGGHLIGFVTASFRLPSGTPNSPLATSDMYSSNIWDCM